MNRRQRRAAAKGMRRTHRDFHRRADVDPKSPCDHCRELAREAWIQELTDGFVVGRMATQMLTDDLGLTGGDLGVLWDYMDAA